MIPCSHCCSFESECRQIVAQERHLPLGTSVHLIRVSNSPRMACITLMGAERTRVRLEINEEYKRGARA